jgi:hypothetical protein
MPTAPYPVQPRPIQKSWLERHANWKIPLGLFILFLLIGVGSLPTLVKMTAIHHSDVYKLAINQAATNAELRAQIGEPIQPAWYISGELQKDTLAKLSIPISGPRGKGVIHVLATKSFGAWWFYSLKADVEGNTASIDLLASQKPATQDSQ